MKITTPLKSAVFIILLHSGLCYSFAQKEFATIQLNPFLTGNTKMLQFLDDQGNLLFHFNLNSLNQFSLIQQNKEIKSQSINFSKKFRFQESIYNQDHFTLFYRHKGNKEVHLYRAYKNALSNQLVPTNAKGPKEKDLLSIFHKGEFLVFNYSKKPFTLHTYRYIEGEVFEKESQVFQENRRVFFWGRIILDEEIIFVRVSLNPQTIHFYRYSQDKGFEKRSLELSPLYEKAGIKAKVAFSQDLYFGSTIDLSSYVDGEDIYVDMDNLINISSLRRSYKRPYPGILRLNWNSGKGEILSFDTIGQWKFRNRVVALYGHLYFKFLTDKNHLQLSIYDIIQRSLIKKYTYHKDQKIRLIHGQAQFHKRSTLYFNLFSLIPVSVNLGLRKIKKIKNKKLLQILASGSNFIEVLSDEKLIELRIQGSRERNGLIAKTEIVNFVAYLSRSDLSIIENFEELPSYKWKTIDQYINNLEARNKNLGEYIVYNFQDEIHLAYIDKKLKQCKIIAF